MNTSSFSAITSGCMCFWDTKDTDAAGLRQSLERLGLGAFAPTARSTENALSLALRDVGTSLKRRGSNGDGKVRMLTERKQSKGDGIELVQVNRRATETNGYSVILTAKATESSIILTHGWLSSSAHYAMEEAYRGYAAQAASSAVGTSLVSIVKHLHGTCVRPVGGVYYLPEGEVEAWADVVRAYEQFGNTISRIRVVMDEMAARTIKQAIVSELTTEAAEVLDDLIRNNIRDDTIQRRLARARQLREKCITYETILNDTLREVRILLDGTEQCQGTAQAIVDDKTIFADCFA